MRVLSLLFVLPALVLSGCLGIGDEEDGSPPPSGPQAARPAPAPKPLASAPSAVDDSDDGGLRFDLMSLNRTGDVVIAQIRLVNVSREDVFVSSNLLGGEWTDTPPGGFKDVSGFALADSESRRLYTALREPDGECLCTDMNALDPASLDPGADVTVYAAFPAPPPSTQTVTVVNPMGQPFPAVPIADGAPPRLPRADQLPDLASIAPDDPVVLPISSLTDSLDRSRSTSENDREVEIRLSTDVLFATNSARLSSRARGLLHTAAAQLKKAGAKQVRLEGHADNTGNDAINEPLSRRRAAAVGRALEPLVGGDVTFTARGFGSRRPVAPNDDPEGRRRNRRVSVVFARPRQRDRGERAPGRPGAPGTQGKPAKGQTVEVRGEDSAAGQTVTVELESLRADGDLATLTYVVRNTGTEEADLSSLLDTGLDDPYRFGRRSLTGLSLVDRQARQRYFVAAVPVSGTQICLCTDTAGQHLGVGSLDPGDRGRFHGTFAVPPSARSVTVELGPDAKLPDVAIER